MKKEEINTAIASNDKTAISDNLYRVQKLSEKNYMFRHHLETQIIDDENSKTSKRYINVRSLGALFNLNPYKIKINILGDIQTEEI